MRYTKLIWLTILIAVLMFLSACTIGQEPEPTPDVGAIFTEAAQTVSAQFSIGLTQTAQAIPPTPTQAPTNTPFPTFSIGGTPVSPLTTPLSPLITPLGGTPGVGGTPFATITPLGALSTPAGDVCNNSQFIADVTYPDGSVVNEKELIAKVWQIKNTGTCTWDDGYSLQHVTGESMGGKPWEITQTSQFVEPGETVEIRVDMQTPATAGEHGGCWQMYGDSGQNFGTWLCISIMVE